MGPKVEGIGLGVGLVWVENKGQKIFVLEKREGLKESERTK